MRYKLISNHNRVSTICNLKQVKKTGIKKWKNSKVEPEVSGDLCVMHVAPLCPRQLYYL